MPTTPADQNGCTFRFLPRSTRPSPLPSRVGVRIATFEACSGFTRYGPLARSAALGGLCHRAPVRSLANRLSATRSNRLLSRWNLPPLATRAYGAHWAKARMPRRCGTARDCVARRAHASPAGLAAFADAWARGTRAHLCPPYEFICSRYSHSLLPLFSPLRFIPIRPLFRGAGGAPVALGCMRGTRLGAS
jgi:hypothetical protein